jgi:hypothetical protein
MKGKINDHEKNVSDVLIKYRSNLKSSDFNDSISNNDEDKNIRNRRNERNDIDRYLELKSEFLIKIQNIEKSLIIFVLCFIKK